MTKKPLFIKKLLLLPALLGLVVFLLPAQAKAGGFIVNGGTVTLGDNTKLISSEEIRLTNGGLIANNAEIILGSTWTRTGATFTRGSSTVTFSEGGDKALVGSTTFYCFRTLGVGYTMKFMAGTTQYITGSIDLEDIFLRSTTNNATWYIRQSTGPRQILVGLDVKDSNAAGGRVMIASNTLNSGNNINWSFPILDTGERYWVGSTAGNWNVAANWSLISNGSGGAQVPLSTHTVIFNGPGSKNGNATLNTNVAVATLTVSGYTGILNTNGYNVTVSTALYHDTGTINFSTSPVTLQGDFVRTGGNFTAGGSTITLSGTKDQTLTSNTTNFHHVVVNKAGGSISLADELIVTGQWTNTSGTSIDNSAVTFAGTVQQLSGSSTFYALRAVTNSSTLLFTAGTTQYVTNMVELRNLTLRSNTSGATWYFDLIGSSQTLMNVDVRDSNARGGHTLLPDAQSIDLGNNYNWAFGDDKRYWVGPADGNWSNAANWSYASGGAGGAPVPASTHTVVFDGRAGSNDDAAITSNVIVATLTLSGYSGNLNTQGYTLTISSAYQQQSGTINLSTSTLDIKGDFTFSGGAFNGGGSTTTITGNMAQNLTSGGISFFNFSFNKTGGSLTLQDPLDIDGQFSYTAGVFTTNSQPITVTGDWRQNTTTLNITDSIVTFDSPTRNTLYGPTTFYALRALTPNATVYFAAGSTTQVTGQLDVQDVYLRSTTNGATWYLRFSGSNQNIVYVDVRDSNANFGQPLYPDAASSNSGNNRNWAFGGDQRYWVGKAASNWNVRNNWSHASGGMPGAPIPTSTHTVVFDGVSGAQGNAILNGNVTIATLTLSGYTTGTLNVNGYTLTISSAYVQTSGVINLSSGIFNIGGTLNRTGGTFTPGASNVVFMGDGDQTIPTHPYFDLIIDKPSGTASLTNAVNVAGSLIINNGTFDTTTSNYAIAVTSHVVINGGLFALNNSTMSVARNWTQAGGVFDAAGSTVNFTGANTPQLITDANFGNLVVSKTANTRFHIIGPMNVAGNFTLTQGTVTTQGYDIRVSSNFTQANGTLFFTTSTVLIGGNFARSGGTFLVGASTIVFNGPVNQTMNTGNSLFNVVIDKPSGAASPAATLTVLGNLSLLNGAFDTTASNFAVNVSGHVLIEGGIFDMNDSAISVQRDWTYNAGTLNVGNSTVNFTGGNPQDLYGGGFGTVVVNKTAGTRLHLATNINTSGRFVLTQGTVSTRGYDLTISSNLTQSNGTLYLTNSLVSVGGNISRSAGSFYPDASTVVLTGDLNQTINSAGVSFYNLTVDKTGGVAAPAVALNVFGDLTLQNGELDTGSNLPITVSSHVIINGGIFDMNNSTISVQRDWTYNAGTLNVGNSTVNFTGGNPQDLYGGGFGTVVVNKTAGTRLHLATNINTSGRFVLTQGTVSTRGYDLTISSNLTQSNGTLYLTNSLVSVGGNISRSAGSFYPDASTVVLTGDLNQTINSAGVSFYNLTVDKTGGVAAPAVALNVFGDLTLQNGELDTGSNLPITVSSHVIINGGIFDMNNSTISVQRDWTYNAGTLNVGNSTVSFTGSNSQSITSGGSSFNSVQVNKDGGSWSLTDDIVLSGTFTYTAGTLDVDGRQITVGRDWVQNAADISLAGSTVVFTGARSTLFGPTTFYGLRALTPNATLYFVRGITQVVTNSLDLEDIYLRSTTNNATWYMRFTGSDQTILNVNVRDSNANNGNTLIPGPGSTDAGNNRNWDFAGPDPITTLAATASSTSTITLNWTATADAVQNPLDGAYRIQYATFTPVAFSTANAQIVFSTANVSPGDLENHLVENLVANTTYFFRIWLGDSRPNWSTLSNGATVTTHAQIVTAVDVSAVDLSSVTVTWTPRPLSPSSDTVKGYVLQLSTHSGFSVFTATYNSTTVTQSSWSVGGLSGGNTYFFRIGSLNWSDATHYAVSVSTLLPIQLGIELSTDTIALGGSTNMNLQLVITTSVIVTNRGNSPATFEFRAATSTIGSPWIVSSIQAVDQFVLWAVINSTEPANGDFTANDILSNNFTPATASAFSMGHQDGVAVPAGATRTLWFKLGTPAATSTGAQQSIQIKGRAKVPD